LCADLPLFPMVVVACLYLFALCMCVIASMCFCPFVDVHFGIDAFQLFTDGGGVWERPNEREDIRDQIHVLVEECDSISGFQCFLDVCTSPLLSCGAPEVASSLTIAKLCVFLRPSLCLSSAPHMFSRCRFPHLGGSVSLSLS
jgi:hypothetical protein